MTEGQQNLLMKAPCGIFSFTEDGVITMVNVYCCELLEYKQNELTGNNISCLLTVSGRIFYQTHFYPLVKLHEHTEEIFLNLQTKSKKDIPVVLNAAASKINGASEIICSFIPVFNRRQYEDEILLAKKTAEEALHKNEELEIVKRELKHQQKALDKQVTLLTFQNKELLRLNDIIAHDLQEPVRKLILFSEELQREHSDARVKDHALSVIKKSSQKIQNLLLNLQEYLEFSAETTAKDPVELTELVEYELRQLQGAYPNTQVQARVDPLPVITGDKKQLNMMFHHLLKNAFEHGTIDNSLILLINAVTVKENIFNSIEDKYNYANFVKITITDSGSGFDTRYKDYIFDILKRLDVTRDTLGFGLAFCKRIAENHSGKIKADSLKGKGATFSVMLPIDYVS